MKLIATCFSAVRFLLSAKKLLPIAVIASSFAASSFLLYTSYPLTMASALLEVLVVTLLVALVTLTDEAPRTTVAENPSRPDKKTHPQAVTGFVDMTSSSALSNLVGISRDWEIKQNLFTLAAVRADEYGMTVLNHTGDGFLFIANFNSNSDWQYNIIAFFEALACDFENLKATKQSDQATFQTGLRFGLALGPAVIGLISGKPFVLYGRRCRREFSRAAYGSREQ